MSDQVRVNWKVLEQHSRALTVGQWRTVFPEANIPPGASPQDCQDAINAWFDGLGPSNAWRAEEALQDMSNNGTWVSSEADLEDAEAFVEPDAGVGG